MSKPTPADRAAANRNRRYERELERLRSQPGMEDAIEDMAERVERDPALMAELGRLVVKGLRLHAIRSAVGRIGGLAANQKLTRQQRIERARHGGRKVFYATPQQRQQPHERVRGEPAPTPEGTEAAASTYGHQLQARRAARRIRLNLLPSQSPGGQQGQSESAEAADG